MEKLIEKLKDFNVDSFKIFDFMIEGIVIHDHDGIIIYSNQAASTILGLDKDQLQGKTSVDPAWKCFHEDLSAFPGDTHPAMVALRTKQDQKGIVMGVTKPDGAISWILVNASVLTFDNTNEENTGVIATFTDITTQIENKKELEAKKEQLERTLSSLVDREMKMVELKKRLEEIESGNK